MEGYFLDTNLLVLLVVGSASREVISRHRRLRDYYAEDYDILCEFLENAKTLYVTPNTLTETSNLVGQHCEPERSVLMRRLEYLDLRESGTHSRQCERHLSNYGISQRLGLTDVVHIGIRYSGRNPVAYRGFKAVSCSYGIG